MASMHIERTVRITVVCPFVINSMHTLQPDKFQTHVIHNHIERCTKLDRMERIRSCSAWPSSDAKGLGCGAVLYEDVV